MNENMNIDMNIDKVINKVNCVINIDGFFSNIFLELSDRNKNAVVRN